MSKPDITTADLVKSCNSSVCQGRYKSMGALFGYCGHAQEGLLKSMADILRHRCKKGWEQTRLVLKDDFIIEIGHGRAPWTKSAGIAEMPERQCIFGASGVFFNAKDVFQSEIPAEFVLKTSPEKQLQALEGAFVAALGKEKECFLIRDPAGIKVLYWAQHSKRLVFASEIKALFADPAVPRKMRIGGLTEYLTFSFVPGQYTMFEDIYELQPGTMLKYARENVSLHRYFVFENKEWDEQNHRLEKAYIEQVRMDLEESVQECCAANNNGEPPAVFLSGGIDSSAVLAVAARKFSHIPLKTFSVHFGAKYANENEYVSMMVRKYQTDHTWLEVRPSRFLKKMRDIIWNLDDPIGDPITVPNFLLAREASKISNLVLNGEGGDPCFGGPKNISMILARIYGPLPGEKPQKWLERNYLLSYRKCFDDLERILHPDILNPSNERERLLDIITPFLNCTMPQKFLNQLMSLNIRLKGANLILVKVDKMSSANGLLALAPLFSKRMIETSMACPPNLKLAGNVEKAVLKHAVKDIVPFPIIDRPKSGMMVPVKFWFMKDMRRYAKKVLSKKNLSRAAFFNIPYIQELLNYEKSETQTFRHGLKLWMLMTFMLWHEQMVQEVRSGK